MLCGLSRSLWIRCSHHVLSGGWSRRVVDIEPVRTQTLEQSSAFLWRARVPSRPFALYDSPARSQHVLEVGESRHQ